MENNQSFAGDYIRIREHYKEAEAQAKEVAGQHVRKGYRYFGYQRVDFKRCEIVPGIFAMIIPEQFGVMDEAVAKAKYPEDCRPDFIYTSPDSKVNLTYSFAAGSIEAREVGLVKQQIMTELMRRYPSSAMEQGELVIAGRPLSHVSFTLPVADGCLFQLLYFMEVDHRLLIGGCSCGKEDQKQWDLVFLEMLETAEILRGSGAVSGET